MQSGSELSMPRDRPRGMLLLPCNMQDHKHSQYKGIDQEGNEGEAGDSGYACCYKELGPVGDDSLHYT